MKSKKLLPRLLRLPEPMVEDAATQSLLDVVPVILASILLIGTLRSIVDSLGPESAFKAEILGLCQRRFKR